MTRRIRLIVTLAAGVLVVSVPVLLNWYTDTIMLRIDFAPLPFDSAKWRENPSEFSHSSVRLKMVDDFLASHDPIGKSRDDVVALLGEPDDTGYFRGHDMVYHLGAERHPLAIDSEWLVMSLDSDGAVIEAVLVRD